MLKKCNLFARNAEFFSRFVNIHCTFYEVTDKFALGAVTACKSRLRSFKFPSFCDIVKNYTRKKQILVDIWINFADFLCHTHNAHCVIHKAADDCVMKSKCGRISYEFVLFVVNNRKHNRLQIIVCKSFNPFVNHIKKLCTANLGTRHKVGKIIVIICRCRTHLRNSELVPAVILFYASSNFNNHI